jgi:hypothetical protein
MRRREKDAPAEAPQTVAQAQMMAAVTNVYLKGGWMNPRLVSGLLDGATVRIRVKDRAAIAPGMQVPVKMVEAGLYEATGAPIYRRPHQ